MPAREGNNSPLDSAANQSPLEPPPAEDLARTASGPEPQGPAQPGYVWLRVPSDAVYPYGETAGRGLDKRDRSNFALAPSVSPPSGGGSGWWSQSDDYYDQSFDFVAWVRRFKRHFWLIIGSWVAIVALVWVLVARMPPTYTAVTTLLIEPKTDGALGMAADLPILGQMLGGMQGNGSGTHVQLLQRQDLLDKALATLPPNQQHVLRQFGSIKAVAARDADLIDITATARTGAAAEALANAVCDQYVLDNQDRSRAQLKSAAEYVGKQLAKVKNQLNQAQVNLLHYQKSHRTVDPVLEAKGHIENVAQIRSEWGAAAAQKTALLGRLAELRQLASQNPSSKLEPRAITRKPAVEAIKGELTRLEMQRVEMSQEYTDSSPPMRNLDSRINQLRGRLRGEAETEVESWQPNPLASTLHQDIAATQSQIWETEARGVALKSQFLQAQKQLAGIPDQQYRLTQLNNDLSSLNLTFTLLNQKYQQLRLSEQAQVSSVTVIGRAEGADFAGPQLFRLVSVAAIFGLLLVLSAVAVMENLDTKIRTDEDAEKASGRSVLARVPFVGSGPTSLLENPMAPSPLLETFRMLRANLEFAAVDTNLRSIAITSSQPNEGKSTSAINLAVVMALDGKRTILVDCDLRRPSLHGNMGLQNFVGFTSVVTGNIALEEALQKSTLENLQLLSAGPLPPNPSEILNSKASRALIHTLMESADIVILDCPPGLVMADAQIVASVADAALLVVAVTSAQRGEVAQTAAQLARSGTHILGVLLNKAELPKSHYKYYDEYFATSGRGKGPQTGGKGNGHANGSTGNGHNGNGHRLPE